MGELGQAALWIYPFVVIYGIFASLKARDQLNGEKWWDSARASTLVLAVLSTISSVSLFYLLITSNFRYEYVVNYTSSDLALFYKMTAFWGGNAGSLLLWMWILTIYIAIVAYSWHQDSRKMLPIIITILLGITSFFIFLLLFIDSPFEKLPVPAEEGNGLNPMLQNPGMAAHPITLYLGYIGFAIPYAYAMAALFLRKTDAIWLTVTRKWTLVSWLFLSMGIIYGGKWSYVELGWGGVWSWDPVENASFMPWLTGTAFLHSAMIQEKKGMLKRWNVSLIILTFILTIFGTFLTRSGVLWSVHSFTNGPLGSFFLAYIGVLLVFSIAVLIMKWETLQADRQFESALSKETSFLVNNLLLIGVAFTVFWGTIYPLISQVITGDKIVVGQPFFNRVSVPIFIALVLLMGICPLIAWKKSTLNNLKRNFLQPFVVAGTTSIIFYLLGITKIISLLSLFSTTFVLYTIFYEFIRGVIIRKRLTDEGYLISFFRLIAKNRRRYGGYFVHLGVVIIVIGMTFAIGYKSQTQVLLKPQEELSFKQYHITFNGLKEQQYDNRNVVFAELSVSQDGKEKGIIRQEKVFYRNGQQPSTEIAILRDWKKDLYVILAGWDEEAKGAVFEVHVNPLMKWVWIGTYIFIFGTMISLWPERRAKRRGTREKDYIRSHHAAVTHRTG